MIIIDEAHTMYAAWVGNIKTYGKGYRPFRYAVLYRLGKLFTNLAGTRQRCTN